MKPNSHLTGEAKVPVGNINHINHNYCHKLNPFDQFPKAIPSVRLGNVINVKTDTPKTITSMYLHVFLTLGVSLTRMHGGNFVTRNSQEHLKGVIFGFYADQQKM